MPTHAVGSRYWLDCDSLSCENAKHADKHTHASTHSQSQDKCVNCILIELRWIIYTAAQTNVKFIWFGIAERGSGGGGHKIKVPLFLAFLSLVRLSLFILQSFLLFINAADNQMQIIDSSTWLKHWQISNIFSCECKCKYSIHTQSTCMNRPQGPWALSYNLCVSHFYYNPYPYTYFDSCIVRLVFVSRVAFCCILLSWLRCCCCWRLPLLFLLLVSGGGGVGGVVTLARSLARPDPKRACSACLRVCVRALLDALSSSPHTHTHSLALSLISLSFFYPYYLAFTCLYFG